MAAPESTPGLTVVSDGTSRDESTTRRPEKPAPRRADRKKEDRGGAPWWLLIVVAVVGLVLFVTQFQRAERLDARVASLTEELAASDQRLEIANLQLAAHQTHLQQVRAGVAALSDQVDGLRALADRDPLAPSGSEKAASEDATATDSETVSPDRQAVEAPASSAVGQPESDVWPAAPILTPDVTAADRRAIIDGAVGTSFAGPMD